MLLPVLRIFAEEDYDHDLFGHIGSHLGLNHWRILWIVIIFFKKNITKKKNIKQHHQLPNQKLQKDFVSASLNQTTPNVFFVSYKNIFNLFVKVARKKGPLSLSTLLRKNLHVFVFISIILILDFTHLCVTLYSVQSHQTKITCRSKITSVSFLLFVMIFHHKHTKPNFLT